VIKKQLFTSIFFLLFLHNFAVQRTLYVDGFNNILGSPMKEDKLLKFAERNSFNTLILYQLNKVDKRFPLTDPIKNSTLAKFISKARLKFGIPNIGASGEAASFFINKIDIYNKSRKKREEKFDIYNLEYEYWSSKASGIDGYYCINYLEENMIPCGREGSFKFFIDNLKDLKKLTSNSKHKVVVEAYASFYTLNEIKEIIKNCDRLSIRAFGKNPKLSYSSARRNLDYLLKTKSKIKTSILFSTTMSNLGRWLKFDSLDKGESLFIREMNIDNSLIEKNVNIKSFSYHIYSDLEKSLSYYSYRKN